MHGKRFWIVDYRVCTCLEDLLNRMNLQKYVQDMVLSEGLQI